MTYKPRNKTRGPGNSEHFAKMLRSTMEEPAWQALNPTAQALYPWLKLEWHGPRYNNNGKIRLSVRQAASRLGVSTNTAARAFHELQAKGFLVVTETACLGIAGHATSPAFELTELALPHGDRAEGRKLYRRWCPGNDLRIIKAAVHNPAGDRKNKNAVISLATSRC